MNLASVNVLVAEIHTIMLAQCLDSFNNCFELYRVSTSAHSHKPGLILCWVIQSLVTFYVNLLVKQKIWMTAIILLSNIAIITIIDCSIKDYCITNSTQFKAHYFV